MVSFMFQSLEGVIVQACGWTEVIKAGNAILTVLICRSVVGLVFLYQTSWMHGLKMVACDCTLMVGWIQDGVSKVRGREDCVFDR